MGQLTSLPSINKEFPQEYLVGVVHLLDLPFKELGKIFVNFERLRSLLLLLLILKSEIVVLLLQILADLRVRIREDPQL